MTPQMKCVPALKYVAALLVAGALPLAVWAQGRGEPAAASPAPRRIVSLNLCADQYLVALADRDQIAGLTHNAAKPEMSAVAAQVGGLRILGKSAEEVLEINPDLVVGMPARRSAVMPALKPQNYPALDLKSADSFATTAGTGEPASARQRARRRRLPAARVPDGHRYTDR